MPLRTLSLPPTALPAILSGAAAAIQLLAGLLLLAALPPLAKLLLPATGGGAPAWLATVVYFHLVLLAGRGGAAWLLRRNRRTQVGTMATLALAALVFSRLTAARTDESAGLAGAVLALAAATLPAMLLLAGAGPVVREWAQRAGRGGGERFEAWSFAAGVALVLAYPSTVERAVGLADQAFFWRGWLWILAGLVGAAGICGLRSGEAAPARPEAPRVPPARWAAGIGLAALACAAMLGATHHLTSEIGSVPLAWVAPFGLYLAGALATSSRWWQPRFTVACLGWLAVSLAGFALVKGATAVVVAGSSLFWVLSLSAAAGCFAFGLLHELCPAASRPGACLVGPAGGLLGALFVGIAGPALFLRPSELLAAAVVLLTAGLVRLLSPRNPLTVIVAALIVAAPVLGLVWKQTAGEEVGAARVWRFRDAYGCLTLKSEENGLVLSSETTAIATQLTADDAARRRPTLYHTESSGVGRAIAELQRTRPEINIAVAGLGAGTLAAYLRPGDTIDFWEIDPQVIAVAQKYFTFLTNARGRVRVMPDDGRRGLQASATDYDLIVIDALHGDMLPPHLLTRQALAVYFRRLEKRHGILVVHAENRFGRLPAAPPERPGLLFPVLAATAHSLGWSSLDVVTDIAKPADDRDWDGTRTEYVLAGRPDQFRPMRAWFPVDEDGGRVTRTVTAYDPQPPGVAVVWTDDRSSVLDVLSAARYLTE